jgi:hypothetical protein
VPPFGGEENLEEGMLFDDGIAPMGAGPSVICRPLVIFKLGTVKQKSMKLFVDVNDAT